VALLGETGSGKSSLLRLLAGVETPDRGKISWDEEDLTQASADLLARVGYVGQDTAFTRGRIWRILGMAGPEAPAPEAIALLRKIGAWKFIERLPNGLKERVGSPLLSRNEARLLRLGAVLLGNAPLWVMDGATDGLSLRRARRCVGATLERLDGRTLIAGFARPVALEKFDRVIELRDGRIRFDGSPQEWNERKLLRKP
ncbi:MAG: ATP-binding cassette domain-containing protein, partial [Planctomycetes bacterium]|nr:ATP-binding cassette domain-containing protein [Planctomycetota bacterium]